MFIVFLCESRHISLFFLFYLFDSVQWRLWFHFQCVIFPLRSKEGLKPFKSTVKDPSKAIYRASGCGPTFGGGHQIKIADNANSNTNSYTNFGSYYSVPSGVQDKSTILAGAYHFSPDEVEVFYLD